MRGRGRGGAPGYSGARNIVGNYQGGALTTFGNSFNEGNQAIVENAIQNSMQNGRGRNPGPANYRQGWYQHAQDNGYASAFEQNRQNAGIVDTNQQLRDTSRFMMEMAQKTANRGVNKAPKTSAQMNGYNPQNPVLFGMQTKDAVPYAKYVLDQNKLDGALRGIETSEGGLGSIVQKIQGQDSIMRALKDTLKQPSVLSGVPRDPMVNLAAIQQINMRKNSIYALT